ncbi:MAG: hypothetical protein M3M94_03210 [Actinomycetota bacterium]|nr:hypothetical protein [Actinomycetota bacterium]
MQVCGRCGGEIEATFRFCPWCADPLRRKIVEFFVPHPGIERRGRALRVSRYLGAAFDERHVRFSIWNESGTAEAAVSLDDREAERLGRFLVSTGETPVPGPRRAGSVLERLRAAVRA